MTRSQCDKLSENVLRIYQDMEDEILRMIAAQIGRDGDVSDTSKWRMRQLARTGRLNAQTIGLISSYADTQAETVYDTVLAAAMDEIGHLDEAVREANRTGMGSYFSDIPAEDSALAAAEAFQGQAADDLNLVNTVMGYKARSTYVDAINGIYYDASMEQDRLDDMGIGAASVVSGQQSLQEATRRTIHRMAQKGIPAFVDKRGREWSPEAYVMMDMRSTLANTAREAQNRRCDEYGIQLIEVSSHMGARPKCAPYQGRIFSRNGTSGTTSDLDGKPIPYKPLSETSFGQPDGLFGINCGHVQYPFIPGVSVQTYFPYDPEKNAERYEEFQKQRAMERDIRAAKRECMMLQAAGDEEGLQAASQRLRAKKNKYSEYCEEKGLGSHLDRTQVYGYDRSKSSKTVWAERKASGTNGSGNNNSSVPSAAGTPFQTSIPNVKVNNSPTNQIVKEKLPVGNGKQELYRGYGQNGLTNISGNDTIKNNNKYSLDNLSQSINDFGLRQVYTVEEIEEELLTSEAGQRALNHINQKSISVTFDYNPVPPYGIRGEQIPGFINVYVSNTSSIQEVAQVLIHEATHSEINSNENTIREEFYCKLREIAHYGRTLSLNEMLDLAREIQYNYREYDLKWRSEDGYKRRGYGIEDFKW